MLTGEQARRAYSRGFDAYGEGVESNPCQWHSLMRGGPLLAGWWDSGYQDAEARRPNRFEGVGKPAPHKGAALTGSGQWNE